MSDAQEMLSSLVRELEPAERALLRRLLDPSRAVGVLGVGCRFPGGGGLEGFWRVLDEGRDTVGEAPGDRLGLAALLHPDPDVTGTTVTKYGAFLDDIAGFDAAAFGISPSEAARMDPQQRLLLEVAWEALDDAGLDPIALRGRRVGVFVGSCAHDYETLQPAASADAHTLTGELASVLSGRLSYVLGAEGPSLTVDTACSSSLVAIHLAVRALREGACDLALAAGVNVLASADAFVRLSRTRALSPDGRCRTFDARATGYARGEGCGVLVLGRADDAGGDDRRVRAWLRGTAVNHDGRSNGLTSPNGRSQESVVRGALSDADLSPDDLDYVEAHGTGTPLGDPIEIEALREVIGPHRPDRPPCTVGSVKTNVGHLEAAAGVAGVIKVMLAMARERIPPHLHLTRVNPRLPLEGSALRITGDATPWPHGARTRRAGVSSFGISGTNAHVIIEEAPGVSRPLTQARAWRHERAWLPPAAPRSGSAHPLLGAPCPVPGETPSWVFPVCFDARRAAWLADHAVGGTPVLPAAATLEIFHSATGLVAPGTWSFAARFLERIEATGGATLRVTRVGGAVQLALFVRTGDRWTLAAEGDASPSAGAPAAAPPVAAARRRCASPIDVGAMYRDLAAIGLGYGSSFRRLVDASRGQAEAIAEIDAPIAQPGMAFHPGAVDAGLQALAVATALDARALPIAVRAFQLFSPIRGPTTALLTVDDDDGAVMECEVSWMDPDGRVVAIARGFRAERIRAAPSPAVDPVDRLLPTNREALTGRVRAVVRAVLGIDPSLDLADEQRLDELGLDSPLAIDVAGALGDALHTTLPATFAMDNPTVAAMADWLCAELEIPE